MWLGCGCGMRVWESLAPKRAARAGCVFARAPLGAPVGRVAKRRGVAIFGAGAIKKLPRSMQKLRMGRYFRPVGLFDPKESYRTQNGWPGCGIRD